MKCPLILAALVLAASSVSAKDHIVDQKDKAFSQKVLKVKVGDNVDFRNSDSVAHNIFSLSEIKSFDLGSYPSGQSKRVTFDKPGTVEVECSIHPSMQMVVEVEK